ncbi:MAG: hypothetical protein AAF349_05435 [Cyanobacteria bacterium P01_A01_bin.68]
MLSESFITANSISSYGLDSNPRSAPKPGDPLSIVIEFLRVIQDLLLLMDSRGRHLDILDVLVSKNLVTDFAFKNFLDKLFSQVSFDELIQQFLTKDSTGYLSLLKMKLVSETTNNLLDVLATKNETVSSQFMSIICQRIDDRLMYFERQIQLKGSEVLQQDASLGKEDQKRDLLIGLSLFKEYLSSTSLKKDLLRLDPSLLREDRHRIISRYSADIPRILAKMKPAPPKPGPEPKKATSAKRKEPLEVEKTTRNTDEPKGIEEYRPRPKREIDQNLKKLLQMAEKKTLKKVLKEFYNRWVKISEDSHEIQKNANIMEKTLNVVEIIVKMRKLDEEIIQQIFKILTELLSSPGHSEKRYIIELVFLMYATEKGALRIPLMKHIIQLPIRKDLLFTGYSELNYCEDHTGIVDGLVFMTDYLQNTRSSIYYGPVRKVVLEFLDKLVGLIRKKLIINSQLIVRKTVVNLMVELSFFLDQNLFDPILAQFTIEQQALIKIYITKKLSKEASM